MTRTEQTAAIAQMQTKRPLITIWQNTNGSFSHHMDSVREWADRISCETDLRFNQEWAQ